MQLLDTKMIWNFDEHNAFPDLIRYNEKWFCALREGSCHVGERDGVIRIIVSVDGDVWETVRLFTLDGSDLRDPKLSITPEGQLMLLAGEHTHSDEKFFGLHVEVSFSSNGLDWEELSPATPDDLMWLWRVTWFKSKGYGIAYNSSIPDYKWEVKLYSTSNGLNYSLITKLDVTGTPSEATIDFLEDGTMLALIRREGNGGNGWFGKSLPPYKEWNWIECDQRISGQDFIILNDGRYCVATRLYDKNDDDKWEFRTSVCLLDSKTGKLYEEVLLPSGGDCSYPSMVVYDEQLWVCYYSSHEGKTSIYLSKISL